MATTRTRLVCPVKVARSVALAVSQTRTKASLLGG
jgi:hypothetical protein